MFALKLFTCLRQPLCVNWGEHYSLIVQNSIFHSPVVKGRFVGVVQGVWCVYGVCVRYAKGVCICAGRMESTCEG